MSSVAYFIGGPLDLTVRAFPDNEPPQRFLVPVEPGKAVPIYRSPASYGTDGSADAFTATWKAHEYTRMHYAIGRKYRTPVHIYLSEEVMQG